MTVKSAIILPLSRLIHFKIVNRGNGPAKFVFIHDKHRVFQITPEEGVVQPYGHLDLTMTYTPPPSHGYINASASVQPYYNVAGM